MSEKKTKEEKAKAYADKWNDAHVDWGTQTEEEVAEVMRRQSCDGCAHNHTALEAAFLAGYEDLEQQVEAARREGFEAGRLQVETGLSFDKYMLKYGTVEDYIKSLL
tara:strand:+ start:449 stop:769 length:321 start_codon:yes stop_codon:yes gene_type:complete